MLAHWQVVCIILKYKMALQSKHQKLLSEDNNRFNTKEKRLPRLNRGNLFFVKSVQAAYATASFTN